MNSLLPYQPSTHWLFGGESVPVSSLQVLFRERMGFTGSILIVLALAWVGTNLFPEYEMRLVPFTVLLFVVVTGALWLMARPRGPRLGASEKRRFTESGFRAVVENGADAVLLVDQQGALIYLSRSACCLLGSTENELLGHTEFELIHADDRSGVQAQLAELVRYPASTASATYRIRHATRAWCWVESRRTNLLHNPEVSGVVIAMRDVSAWKETQVALTESESRYKQLADCTPNLIYESSPTGEIVYVNARVLQFLGVRSVATARTTFWKAIHPDDLERLREGWDKSRRSDSPFKAEVRIRDREGHYYWNVLHEQPVFDNQNQVSSRVGALSNIDDRRKLEEQLRHSQKMEAVGLLAGGIAHDFNNVLTVINSSGRLAQAATPPEHPAYPMLREVIRSADRAIALTRKLMVFARKQVFTPQRQDLNNLVIEMSLLLQRILGETIAFEMKLEPRLRAIQGDAGLLEQVLLNLVVNARDAMPSGGTLTIQTRNVDEVLSAEPVIELSVSDTGCGISEEIQQRIFEPFFTTKELGKGTGLGLAIVYGAIKDHQGTIEVDSRPGKGTTFRILLPSLNCKEHSVCTETPMTAVDVSQQQTAVVFIVEDEDVVRQLTRLILKSAGHQVHAFENARQLLDFLPTYVGKIDLLVTDVSLPGMGGPELAEMLSSDRPDLSVLFVSGYPADSHPQISVCNEQSFYLEKPFTPATLTLKVREILNKRRALASNLVVWS